MGVFSCNGLNHQLVQYVKVIKVTWIHRKKVNSDLAGHKTKLGSNNNGYKYRK